MTPDTRTRRFRGTRYAVLLLLATAALGALIGFASPRGEFWLGGIQVNEDDLGHWLDRLRAAKMNTVSVTDYAHQGDWDSSNLWFDGESDGEVREIRAAKKRGLHVVLILRVALDHAFPRNRFLWHGMIQPTSDAEVEEWFRRYGSFAREWARIAEQEGVDALMIGSELNALTNTLPLEELPALEEWYLNDAKRQEGRERVLEHAAVIEGRHLSLPYQDGYDDLGSYLDDRIETERGWARSVAPSLEAMNARRRFLLEKWTELIADLRLLYHGQLGYAANFDQVEEVAFWDQLDVMGINAYYQLRRELRPEATAEELYPSLLEGWREILTDLQEFRESQGVAHQPIVFTEMGYTFRRNSTLEPWASNGFSLLPLSVEANSTAAATAVATQEGGTPTANGEGGTSLDAEPEPMSNKANEEGGTRAAEEPERHLVVWKDQPVDHGERALAVRALWQVLEELPEPRLQGILYWKLSTVPSHKEIEPFVLLLADDEDDPLLGELQRFVR